MEINHDYAQINHNISTIVTRRLSPGKGFARPSIDAPGVSASKRASTAGTHQLNSRLWIHMERRRTRRMTRHDSSEDSEECVETSKPPKPPSSGEPKRTKPKKTIATQTHRAEISPEDMNLIVNDIIRRLLNAQVTHRIVTREDIIRVVLDLHKVSLRNKFSLCMDTVKDRLLAEFGFELVEIKHDKTKSKYILVDHPTPREREHSILFVNGMDQSERAQYAVIFLIVGIVVLNGEAILEDPLLRYLAATGIKAVPGREESLSDFMAKTLVKQGYLKTASSVDEASGKKVVRYSIGVRTYAEFGKHNILKWIAAVHGDTLDPAELEAHKRANERILQENYDEFEDANLINGE